MGLSFHNEGSMMEASSIGSLHFASQIPQNPIPEHGIVDEERGDDSDNIETQLSDDSDIQMVDRRNLGRKDSSIHTKELDR